MAVPLGARANEGYTLIYNREEVDTQPLLDQDRKYYRKTVGLIIRDGRQIYDDDDGAKKRAFPPLDTFAFCPDGRMAQAKSADSFLADGARDVL